jgi:O-antigen/teichoic acid export membrane protein
VNTLKKYKKYPLFNGPHALIDVVQDNVIIFLIGAYFQFSMVAFFGQALRIMKAPFNFIGSAIFQVIYPKFNVLANEGKDLRPYLKRLYLQLGLLGLPFFASLFFLGAPAFRWLLGYEWEESGRIASILAPWLFLNFLSSPFSCMALIRNRQDVAMGFTLINALLRIGAIVAGGLLKDVTMAFALMSGAGSLVFIALLVWYYRLAAQFNPADQSRLNID